MEDDILDKEIKKWEKYPSSIVLFSFLGIVLFAIVLQLLNIPYSGWVLIYSVPVLLSFGILRALFYQHNTFNRFLPLFFSFLVIRRVYIRTVLDQTDLILVSASALFLITFVLGFIFLDWKK